MTEEERSRRRAAKLVNERLKLAAAFCNTIAVGSFVTLVLAPLANDKGPSMAQVLVAVVAAAISHGAAQLWLFAWRSED